MHQKFNSSINISSYSLTFFWGAYSLGCLAAGLTLKKVKVDNYILFSVGIAILGYIFLLFSYNIFIFFISTSVLGFGCSAIYGSFISYGSLLLKHPSPRLLSFFICFSGIGSLVSQQYSSYIMKYGTPSLIIKISLILMIFVFFITLYLRKKNRH